MRTKLASAIAALAALLVAASAASAAKNFTTPVQLSNPPVGGEPSIATDSFGDVFVAGPQGIPSGLSGVPGIGFWISRDDGNTFQKGTFVGSYIGGGDDDVINDQNTIYVTDLEAAASEVCKSTDRGNTFTGVGPAPDNSNCTTIAPFAQTAPSDDRPWLAADPSDAQRVYEVYHEFVSAQPIAFRTDNGGADDFAHACGSIITDPQIESNVPTDITGGTLVARPQVGKDGTLYVMFATTTQQENLAAFAQGEPSGTFSQLYLAVSHDHCQTFTDYTVFDGSKLGTNTVQFGDVFNDLTIDGAGNLYAVAAGAIGTKPFPTTANLYVLTSTDHGQHWTTPRMIDTAGSAHMLPAAIGGPKAGQLAIGYFRTINGVTNPGDSSAKWTYSTAETTNGTASNATFTYRDVRPGFSYHNGDICNLGILCGMPGQPSDRSLLDFTSAALDTHGCPLFTFAGNPTGSPGNNTPDNTHNFVTRQLVGCFASTAGVAKHHKKHHKRHHKKHRRRHHVRSRRSGRRPSFTG
jgi:hypothetical protein